MKGVRDGANTSDSRPPVPRQKLQNVAVQMPEAPLSPNLSLEPELNLEEQLFLTRDRLLIIITQKTDYPSPLRPPAVLETP
jgi:hypothetical protein